VDSRSASQANPDTAGGWITILGGALAVLSALVPWFTAQAGFVSVSRNSFQLGNNQGFSADGVVLLILGIATILIGLGRSMRVALPSFIQRSPIVTGIAILIVPFLRVGSINDLVQRVHGISALASASIGFGVWIAIVAGLVSIVGGLVLRSGTPVNRLATGPPGFQAPPSPAGSTASDSQAPQPPPTGVAFPAPGTDAPAALRECPFCKEGMRRDASVCPHCRRESSPWRYDDGRWWSVASDGAEMWLDEPYGRWRRRDDVSPDAPGFIAAHYDVVILEWGPRKDKVIKEVAVFHDDPRRFRTEAAASDETPKVVLHNVQWGTADAARSQTQRKGATVDVVEIPSQ
jgi:hypothetical protein